jgi:hypothetical protein
MKREIAFYLCLIVSIGLFVGGFFVPPTGVIDGSILQATGILFGFATLAQIPGIISAAKSIKVQHGNTMIEATSKHKQPEEDNK